MTTRMFPQKSKTASERAAPPSTGGGRLLSIDAFRGLAILLMLLVNNFGSPERTPLQFRHAGWEGGIHLADMAFPWFLFCVGVSIPFSVASLKRKGLSRWQFELKILRRVITLLALGALLDTVGDYRLTFFTIGVLQTIAISYAVGMLLYDLTAYRRMIFAGFGLVIYWAMIKFVPIPGVGAGAFAEQQNFILHLNRTYLGQIGLWNLPRIIPTTALVLIGTVIGDTIRRKDINGVRRSAWILAIGACLTLLGCAWSLSLPFNKPIWTSPYVIFAAGTGTLTLGIFYLLIDVKGYRSWPFPLVVFGSNAILAYVLPILSKPFILSPFDKYIDGWIGVTLFSILWWVILWQLYRRKLFLKA